MITYKNGSYTIALYPNGTKVREGDTFIPEFAESVDLKITGYCDAGCSMCHESSTRKGIPGDLESSYLTTFRPGTEVAIGGGNPLSHSGFVPFINELSKRGVIANVTINQLHLVQPYTLDSLIYLQARGLLHGIGVSLVDATDEFIETVEALDNEVIHVINKYHTLEQIKPLMGRGLKLLILGYKEFGRGSAYKVESSSIYDNIHEILNGFEVVTFDNLAIKQLRIKRILLKDEWDEFYMGDDGQFTFYIDAVQKKFARSSTSVERFDVLSSVDDMFQVIRR